MTHSKDPDRVASPPDAGPAASRGFFGEFLHFLRHNKRWWLLPIVLILLFLLLVVAVSGQAVAPFIYTLF